MTAHEQAQLLDQRRAESNGIARVDDEAMGSEAERAATLSRLATLLRLVEGTWAFAVYEDGVVRHEVAGQLAERLAPLPVIEISLLGRTPDPLAILNGLDRSEPPPVVAFTNVGGSLSELAGYLDLQRELLAARRERLLFWVSKWEWQQLAEHAPNFTSRLSGVFPFPGRSAETVQRGAEQIALMSELNSLSGKSTAPEQRHRPYVAVEDESEIPRQIGFYKRRIREMQEQALPDWEALADAWYDLAGLHERNLPHQWAQAADAYAEAARAYAAAGNVLARAGALYEAGDAASRAYDSEMALEHLRRAFNLYNLLEDGSSHTKAILGQANVYRARGDVFAHESRHNEALSVFDQALRFYRRVGDQEGEGTTLNNISQIYHARGDYETALSYLHQSLIIQHAIGDREGEGTTLNNIAQIYKARGDYEAALNYLKRSLAITRAFGSRAGESAILNNMAGIYDMRGNYEQALDYLQQSLAITRTIGYHEGEGRALNNIAGIYDIRGDYQRALDYLQQSLAIQRAIDDQAGESATLNNISQIYHKRGDNGRALEYLQQSLAIARAIDDRAGEGAILNNIAGIYRTQDDEIALDYLQQSLAIQRAIGNIAGMCASLLNLGHIHAQKGEMDEAMGAWLTVYRLAKPMGLAQMLEALAQLAPQVGLPEGLKGWETLAQQTQDEMLTADE